MGYTFIREEVWQDVLRRDREKKVGLEVQYSYIAQLPYMAYYQRLQNLKVL